MSLTTADGPYRCGRCLLAASPLTGFEDQDCRAEVMAKVQSRMQAAIELAQTRAASEVAAR